jgi:hypothetical protein
VNFLKVQGREVDFFLHRIMENPIHANFPRGACLICRDGGPGFFPLFTIVCNAKGNVP